MKALQWLWSNSPEKRIQGSLSFAGTDSPALSPPWEAKLKTKLVDLNKQPDMIFQS